MEYERVVRAGHFREGGRTLVAEAFYDPPNEMLSKDLRGNVSAAYGFAAQAALVEVSLATGQVRVLKVASAHDVGRALNPLAAEGQIHGGIHMGLGYALSEELRIEEGRVLNPQFMEYALLTAADMPEIVIHLIETVDEAGPFGAKGLGESGVIPVAAAVANAVKDAVGVRLTELPMTPERVFRALRDATGVMDAPMWDAPAESRPREVLDRQTVEGMRRDARPRPDQRGLAAAPRGRGARRHPRARRLGAAAVPRQGRPARRLSIRPDLRRARGRPARPHVLGYHRQPGAEPVHPGRRGAVGDGDGPLLRGGGRGARAWEIHAVVRPVHRRLRLPLRRGVDRDGGGADRRRAAVLQLQLKYARSGRHRAGRHLDLPAAQRPM